MTIKTALLSPFFIVCTLGGFVPMLSHANQARTATEIVGLWSTERDFGPLISGMLNISRENKRWIAEIAGFQTEFIIEGSKITFDIPGDKGAFKGSLSDDHTKITGHWIQPPTKANFVRFTSPVELLMVDSTCWQGKVRPLDDKMTFYLSLTERSDGTIGGFFRNPEANFGRYFIIENVLIGKGFDGNNYLSFVEPNRTELRLQGPYDPENDVFSIYIPDAGGTFDFRRIEDDFTSTFVPMPGLISQYEYKKPIAKDDGWKTATLEETNMATEPIEKMIQLIIDTPIDSITSPYIHAVLIARYGKLVVEEYFHGFTAEMPHDTRSASKSLTSTLIGLAVLGGEPILVSSGVYEIMYAGHPPEDLDPRKKRVTLEHLLTMTPGLACDDNDSESPGNEDIMQSQSDQLDWWQYTLDLPSLHEPGEIMTYCSGSPNLAGGVLSRASNIWLPVLYQKYMAKPLRFGNYHINLMPNGEPYGGGGLQIQGRDFLKIAQLFLNNGSWDGKRLLSEKWVHDALTPYKRMFEQGYGYGWWILELPYEDRTVTAFYAGGNGGQYSMGIPELDLAIVFFGGNYGQSVTHLVKKEHIPNYILKSVSQGIMSSK